MLAFAQQQVTTCRQSITQAQGYVWPVKNSGSSYSSECSDEFACAHVCVVFRFHLGRPYCLRLCFASPVKTRLKSRFGVKTSMSGKLGTALSNFGTRPCSASIKHKSSMPKALFCDVGLFGHFDLRYDNQNYILSLLGGTFCLLM